MRSGRIFLAAVVLGVTLAATSGVSAAVTLLGSKANELLAGTHGADRLKGRAGNDLIRGRAGNDLLNGGAGRDTLIGGPGIDRIIGGPGNDTVLAADGRPDRINGGGGSNTCVIDIPLDLPSTVNCGTLQAGSAPAPGGGGGGGAGGGGGQGGTATLHVSTAQGLTCLPLLGCLFTVTGTGADSLVGTVTSGGAVTSVVNVGVNALVTGTWLATGTYYCGPGGGDGYLVVHMGERSTPQIPVKC